MKNIQIEVVDSGYHKLEGKAALDAWLADPGLTLMRTNAAKTFGCLVTSKAEAEYSVDDLYCVVPD